MSSRSASIYLAVAEMPARFTTGIQIGDCHHPQATHECRPNRRQTLPPLVHRAPRFTCLRAASHNAPMHRRLLPNLAISPQTRVVAGVSVVNRGVHVRHEDVGLGDGVDSTVVADGGLGRDCLVEIIDNESEPNTGDDSTSKKDETYIELMRRAQDGSF